MPRMQSSHRQTSLPIEDVEPKELVEPVESMRTSGAGSPLRREGEPAARSILAINSVSMSDRGLEEGDDRWRWLEIDGSGDSGRGLSCPGGAPPPLEGPAPAPGSGGGPTCDAIAEFSRTG